MQAVDRYLFPSKECGIKLFTDSLEFSDSKDKVRFVFEARIPKRNDINKLRLHWGIVNMVVYKCRNVAKAQHGRVVSI